MLTHVSGILKKKKTGTDEPNGGAGIKMYTQRMDLRTWGGEGEARAK